MGYTASIIAVKCEDKSAVLRALQFRETQQPITFLKATLGWKAKPAVSSLDSGWTLLVGHFERFEEALLRDASRLGMLMTCSMVTTVDWSEARAYRDGEVLWSIVHDGCEHGDDHLEVTGKLTPEALLVYEDLWAKHLKESGDGPSSDDMEEEGGDDWLMEMPLEATAAVCGVRPDLPFQSGAPDLNMMRVKPLSGWGTPFVERLLTFGRKRAS